jgi:uncharacterized protein YijF (DUF1287 family)
MKILIYISIVCLGLSACYAKEKLINDSEPTVVFFNNTSKPLDTISEPKGVSIMSHALWQTTQHVTYDPSYVTLKYPGGDVPSNKGVCTDVVIRAYRSMGKDLQVLVNEYMKQTGQTSDKNIDHRRCKVLKKYFTYNNLTLPVTMNESDYQPGDIVFWDIAAGHVGLVTDEKVPGTNRYYIVHNICCGPQKEDYLFSADIIMHVRWKV